MRVSSFILLIVFVNKGSLQHQIEQVLNIVLLHCSDFEYLDDPIKASEHDPLRYYNPQPNSMCELLSAMLKNLASNTGKSTMYIKYVY